MELARLELNALLRTFEAARYDGDLVDAERAVVLADHLEDGPARVEARYELARSYLHNAVPSHMSGVVDWMVHHLDQPPHWFGERESFLALWVVKWWAHYQAKLPHEHVADIDRTVSVFAEQLARYGHGQEPVLSAKFENALALGRASEVGTLFDVWSQAEREPLSDCPACHVQRRVAYLAEVGALGQAHEEAEPVLSGLLTCAEQPQGIIAATLPVLAGRTAEHVVRFELLRGLRRLHREGSRLGVRAQYLDFLVTCGESEWALRVAQDGLPLLFTVEQSTETLAFAHAALRAFTMPQATGRIRIEGAADPDLDISAAAALLGAYCSDLGQRFALRNQMHSGGVDVGPTARRVRDDVAAVPGDLEWSCEVQPQRVWIRDSPDFATALLGDSGVDCDGAELQPPATVFVTDRAGAPLYQVPLMSTMVPRHKTLLSYVSDPTDDAIGCVAENVRLAWEYGERGTVIRALAPWAHWRDEPSRWKAHENVEIRRRAADLEQAMGQMWHDPDVRADALERAVGLYDACGETAMATLVQIKQAGCSGDPSVVPGLIARVDRCGSQVQAAEARILAHRIAVPDPTYGPGWLDQALGLLSEVSAMSPLAERHALAEALLLKPAEDLCDELLAANRARALLPGGEFPSTHLQALFIQVHCYLALESWQCARDALEEAEALAERAGATVAWASCHKYRAILCDVAADGGHDDRDAERHLWVQSVVLHWAQYPRHAAEADLALMDRLESQGRLHELAAVAEDALAAYCQATPKTPDGSPSQGVWAEYTSRLADSAADACLRLQEVDAAIPHLELAVRSAQAAGDTERLPFLQWRLGQLLADAEPTQAVSHFRAALAGALASGNARLELLTRRSLVAAVWESDGDDAALTALGECVAANERCAAEALADRGLADQMQSWDFEAEALRLVELRARIFAQSKRFFEALAVVECERLVARWQERGAQEQADLAQVLWAQILMAAAVEFRDRASQLLREVVDRAKLRGDVQGQLRAAQVLVGYVQEHEGPGAAQALWEQVKPRQ